ncbi:MAG: acetyl-CoA carboxylase biotin carboxyl carrier protein subunit [Aggregatilineales bacterium]
MRYTYTYNGQTYTIDLERQDDGRYHAKIGDREHVFAASSISKSGWLLQIQKGRQVAYGVADGDKRHVQVNGQSYTFEKQDERSRRRKQSGGGSGTIIAEMPGQVLEVRIAPGEHVKSGDVLLVLEAMKMEIRVNAPLDGQVKALQVQAGDTVERGQILLEITPETEPQLSEQDTDNSAKAG